MRGGDDSGRADEFLAALGSSLEAHGWQAGERTVLELPTTIEPSRATVIQRFDRPVDDGWVARLTVDWGSGSETLFLPLRSYVRNYVHVEGAATIPAAEELARRCGRGGSLAIGSAAAFSSPRSDAGERRIRGPQDYDAAIGEIVGYAEHALLPWARGHANLEHWLASRDEAADALPDPFVDPFVDPFGDACGVAAMLAAHGRGQEALARLDAVRGDPPTAAAPELESFTERLAAFVETGVLPDPPVRDRDDPPLYEADRTAEDPIRKEFYEGFNAELAEESLGTRWRYFGRQLRSAARMVRALGGDEPSGLTWWAPAAVSVEVEVEELLDRAYEAAGPAVDRRVGLQVELGGLGSGPDGGVEVRIGRDVVGVLRPADIPTWGIVPTVEGVRRAKLKRKRERPRFLLEVDIG